MRDVMDRLAGWWANGHRVAIGTVIQTWSSAPRAPVVFADTAAPRPPLA